MNKYFHNKNLNTQKIFVVFMFAVFTLYNLVYLINYLPTVGDYYTTAIQAFKINETFKSGDLSKSMIYSIWQNRGWKGNSIAILLALAKFSFFKWHTTIIILTLLFQTTSFICLFYLFFLNDIPKISAALFTLFILSFTPARHILLVFDTFLIFIGSALLVAVVHTLNWRSSFQWLASPFIVLAVTTRPLESSVCFLSLAVSFPIIFKRYAVWSAYFVGALWWLLDISNTLKYMKQIEDMDLPIKFNAIFTWNFVLILVSCGFIFTKTGFKFFFHPTVRFLLLSVGLIIFVYLWRSWYSTDYFYIPMLLICMLTVFLYFYYSFGTMLKLFYIMISCVTMACTFISCASLVSLINDVQYKIHPNARYAESIRGLKNSLESVFSSKQTGPIICFKCEKHFKIIVQKYLRSAYYLLMDENKKNLQHWFLSDVDESNFFDQVNELRTGILIVDSKQNFSKFISMQDRTESKFDIRMSRELASIKHAYLKNTFIYVFEVSFKKIKQTN